MEIKKQAAPMSEQEIAPYYDTWKRIFDETEANTAKRQLLGEEAEYNEFVVYSAWEGDTLLGTVHITKSKLVPSLSTLGCACTTEEARGKGVSKHLFRAVLEDFDAEGGVVSYLGTGNPVAINLYQSFGYHYIPGTYVMRRFTDSNLVKFAEEFYAKSECTILENSPYLRTLIIPLLTEGKGPFMLDSNFGHFNTNSITQHRCESLYPQYENIFKNGGTVYSAHNKQGAACAVGSVKNDRIEVFWYPGYEKEAGEIVKLCEKKSNAPFAFVGAKDEKKRALFTDLGYSQVGEETELKFGGYKVPVVTFKK